MSPKRGYTSEGREVHRAKKVFVGMSGGVDSSVTAALLKEAGYGVEGVFIKVWQPDFFPCTAAEDRLDAMRVCAHLDIPFRTLDLEEMYKRHVLDYMIDGYARGETPNPDVMCNKWIKFGSFLSYARSEGADAVATGHYAQVLKRGDTFELHRGTDPEKDQSYFLWMLTQNELSHSLFPVGTLKKTETRALARKFGLPTAEKKDSQGLCFLGKLDMADFLKRHLKLVPGDVVNERGEVIGRHEGALLYTIGQRHGFTIHGEGNGTRAHYVLRKELEQNRLVVGEQSGGAGRTKETGVLLRSVNWIAEMPAPGDTFEVQVRYRQKPLLGVLKEVQSETARVDFSAAASYASGQSCVLYEGTRCLGGGIIGGA